MTVNNPLFLTADAREPASLTEWINYEHSLTDKLQKLKGATQLNLLAQDWVRPSWWDKMVLRLNDDLIYQREIIMSSLGQPYWYARTVIPAECYHSDSTFFKRLEHESIRNLIFDSKEVSRVSTKTYPVDAHCLEFYWVRKHVKTVKQTLWVRFAEYSFKEKASFYLMEILLPELGTVQS